MNSARRTDLLAVAALMAQGSIDGGLFIFRRNDDCVGGAGFLAELATDASVFMDSFRKYCKTAEEFLKGSKGAKEVVEHCRSVSEGNKYGQEHPER